MNQRATKFYERYKRLYLDFRVRGNPLLNIPTELYDFANWEIVSERYASYLPDFFLGVDYLVRRVFKVLFGKKSKKMYNWYSEYRACNQKLTNSCIEAIRACRKGSVERRAVRVILFSSFTRTQLVDIMQKYEEDFKDKNLIEEYNSAGNEDRGKQITEDDENEKEGNNNNSNSGSTVYGENNVMELDEQGALLCSGENTGNWNARQRRGSCVGGRYGVESTATGDEEQEIAEDEFLCAVAEDVDSDYEDDELMLGTQQSYNRDEGERNGSENPGIEMDLVDGGGNHCSSGTDGVDEDMVESREEGNRGGMADNAQNAGNLTDGTMGMDENKRKQRKYMQERRGNGRLRRRYHRANMCKLLHAWT